jgi:hypothetical protein
MRLASVFVGEFVATWPQLGKLIRKVNESAAVAEVFTVDAIYFRLE